MAYWLFYALMGEYGKSLFESLIFIVLFIMLPAGIIYGLFTLACGIFREESSFYYILVIPSLWVLTESITELVPITVPWSLYGYSILPLLRFAQIGDITGIYGISFILVMINSIILGLILKFKLQWAQREKDKITSGLFRVFLNNKTHLILLLLVIFIPFLYGSIKIKSIEDGLRSNTRDIRSVSLVQGNFTQKERWLQTNFNSRTATYLKLSKDNSNHDSKLIIWPETVLNSAKRINYKLLKNIISSINADSTLIAGGIRRGRQKNGVYNSAYIISGNGSINWYDKNILLPYAENNPAGNILGNYYNAPSEFIRGETNPTIATSHGNAGVSICFEILYPWHIRNSVKTGAQFLVNISNDSWFGRSSMPLLHLDAARMRAIENRRFMLRASNSGISAIITPSGNIEARSSLFTRETINGLFALSNELSFYSKHGDWILYLACGILIIFIIIKTFEPFRFFGKR